METNENTGISADALLRIFADCGDLQTREISPGLLGGGRIFLCWLDGVTDGGAVSEEIIRPLTEIFRTGIAPTKEKILAGAVYSCSVSIPNDLQSLVDDICRGCCGLVFPDGEALSFEVKTKNVRSIAAPQVEKSLKGGKDGFTERLRTNTALVRSKISSPELKEKELTVGRRSQTRCAVLYVDGITDQTLVTELLRRLSNIDLDGVLATGDIEEYIVDHPRSPFPQLLHTERPDRFARQLLAGRVGLLVDGLPLAFLVPVSLPELLRVPQDESLHYTIASVLSVVRWLALLLALLLPAFYVAVAMYHPEMIPTKLLLSIIKSKQSVPFSTALEVLGMLVAFELLQEASLRLPDPIAATTSIIGALIVGQSAVEAKVISPIAVIVVALAGISGYAQPSQDLAAALRIWRFLLVIAAVLAGLFGVAAGFTLLVWRLAGMDSFGMNYTAPLSGGRPQALRRTLLRPPKPEDKMREPELKTRDKRRQR